MKAKYEIDLNEEPEFKLFSLAEDSRTIDLPEEPGCSELRDWKTQNDSETRKMKEHAIRRSDEEIEESLQLATGNQAFSVSEAITGKQAWHDDVLHCYKTDPVKHPVPIGRKPAQPDPHMMQTHSVRMRDEHVKILNAAAAKVGALSKTGSTYGQPSWRAMLHDIVEGRLDVVEKGAKAKPPAEPKPPKAKKPWKGYWKHRASWWEPDDGNAMLTGEVVQKSGLTVDQLVAGGLLLIEDGNFVQSPAKWGGWKYNKADAARDR
jgi:hypothetical protein